MEFVCRVGTADGRVLEQVLDARDEVALKGELDRRGYHVFEVRRRGVALRLPSFARRRAHVPAQAFLVFNQELAALLRAGLPLLQGLDLMLERLEDPGFRGILTDIRDKVRSGMDLSEAFASYGSVFPALYAASLQAGERTGDLEAVIRRYIRYSRLVLEARKKVISALVYPAVLVCLSIVMILVMTVYVVPKFMVFFADLEAELPLPTKVTLAVSFFLRHNWPWIVGLIVAGAWFLRRFVSTEAGRREVDRWKLSIPFLGPVLQRFARSEFCRSLATLLAGGIPLVTSLEISIRAVGNAHVRGLLEPTAQQVREGQQFYATLESAGTFESLEIDMIRVGEATGQLDTMLSSVSDFLDEQVETRMARILSLIEPLMLVFMGGIVAILLVSIYLPMFSVLGSSKF